VTFEFDPEKDRANLAKHGVSLVLGAVVLENLAGEIVDDRRDYGELRLSAFGMVAGRLFVCTYTKRGDVVRIISVRKASRQERKFWQR
jgi:uncharacterized DUF497 family protein